jgi:hypothetical protein
LFFRAADSCGGANRRSAVREKVGQHLLAYAFQYIASVILAAQVFVTFWVDTAIQYSVKNKTTMTETISSPRGTLLDAGSDSEWNNGVQIGHIGELVLCFIKFHK